MDGSWSWSESLNSWIRGGRWGPTYLEAVVAPRWLGPISSCHLHLSLVRFKLGTPFRYISVVITCSVLWLVNQPHYQTAKQRGNTCRHSPPSAAHRCQAEPLSTS